MAEDLGEIKICSIIEQTLWMISEKPEKDFKDTYSCKLTLTFLSKLKQNLLTREVDKTGPSTRLSNWRGLVTKAGNNLGALLICFGYSIALKGSGLCADGKWPFMGPSC